MIVCKNAQEFAEYIADKKILIYGTGYVAIHFLEALQRQGLDQKIQGFVISRKNGKQSEVEGFPVREIDEVSVNDEAVICVAVHESVKTEITAVLERKGYFNYIWIYPYLYHLYYGDPVREGAWIDIGKLVQCEAGKYTSALRWAAIEDYYGKCPQGFYLYRKGIALHAHADTAKARETSFRNLIQRWDACGYDPEKQIAINEAYEVIDGEHRVVVGLYHGQQKMRCKIYSGENLHDEESLMTGRVLTEGGFTAKEMNILDNINLNIRNLIS